MKEFEFGTSFLDEVVYMGDVSEDTPEEYARFIDRTTQWLESHSLTLGEGVVRFLVFSEGPSAYQMRAPRISGPDNIIEPIIH